MKKAKFMLLVINILLVSYNVNSQDAYQPNKVLLPSPTAASLGIYGDVPVSYYTGTPEITIPLYDVKANSNGLSIKIQYNASGIKVSQDASWVGLGWSLSAGGVITRSVRGKDDFDGEGYHYAPALPPNDDENNYLNTSTDSLQNALYFLDIINSQKDGEPDMFYYNFGDYSGKFVLGKHADGDQILMRNKNNLRIKFDHELGNLGNIIWTAQTPDGYRYVFRTPERAKDYYSSSDLLESEMVGLTFFQDANRGAITAWYLDSIVAPNGEFIKFKYRTGASLSLISSYQKRYDLVEVGGSVGEAPPLNSVFNYHSIGRQAIDDIILDRIEYTNGHIEFTTTNRDDIEPTSSTIKPQKLTEITIYNTIGLIKKYEMQYTYFDDYQTSNNYSNKRLKLDNIIEYGADGLAKNPYKFEYFAPNDLPHKYSKQIDDWGFYGIFSQPTLTGDRTPTLLPVVQTNTWTGQRYFDGTNRQADQTGERTKRGMLKAITYPTKGKTEFEYEPHTYYYSGENETSVSVRYMLDDINNNVNNVSFSLNVATTVTFIPIN